MINAERLAREIASEMEPLIARRIRAGIDADIAERAQTDLFENDTKEDTKRRKGGSHYDWTDEDLDNLRLAAAKGRGYIAEGVYRGFYEKFKADGKPTQFSLSHKCQELKVRSFAFYYFSNFMEKENNA